jgi:probable F420-dependent oxidoreductase
MEFWHSTAFIDPTELPALAVACEDAGFGGLLVSDHLLYPETIASAYPYQDDGQAFWTADTPWIDSWVAIAAMAAVTERVRFSHAIYVFPLRNPVEVAKLAGSAAVMSGGRVALGAGVGWMAEEFEILGEDYTTRGRRTDEGFEVCRKLWTGEKVSHDGEFYSFPPVTMSPAPPGGSMPIWIGGHSEPALRRSARNDGWVGNAYPLDEADAVLDRLDAHLRANGRHLGDGYECILGIYSLDPDDFRRFAERGVTGFLAAPAMLAGYDAEAKGEAVTLEARLAAVARFGQDVIAPLAG